MHDFLQGHRSERGERERKREREREGRGREGGERGVRDRERR